MITRWLARRLQRRLEEAAEAVLAAVHAVRLSRLTQDPRVRSWRDLATILALWWALLRLLRDLRERDEAGRG